MSVEREINLLLAAKGDEFSLEIGGGIPEHGEDFDLTCWDWGAPQLRTARLAEEDC